MNKTWPMLNKIVVIASAFMHATCKMPSFTQATECQPRIPLPTPPSARGRALASHLPLPFNGGSHPNILKPANDTAYNEIPVVIFTEYVPRNTLPSARTNRDVSRPTVVFYTVFFCSTAAAAAAVELTQKDRRYKCVVTAVRVPGIY